MMQRGRALLLSAALAAVPIAAQAALTPLMDFEGFPTGQPLPANAYPGFTWNNDLVFSAAGAAFEPPFSGPNVLAASACPVGASCDLELISAQAIQQFSISGSGTTVGGPDLFVLALDAGGNVVTDVLGNANLVVDTELQSVGCSIPTGWSCDRTFSFAVGTGVTTLRIITSQTSVIDNLQITTFDVQPPPPNGVSEPAMLALVGLGLLGAAAGHRREKR